MTKYWTIVIKINGNKNYFAWNDRLTTKADEAIRYFSATDAANEARRLGELTQGSVPSGSVVEFSIEQIEVNELEEFKEVAGTIGQGFKAVFKSIASKAGGK